MKKKDLQYKIKSGRYKGYEVCWTDGGQIFSRLGFYLQKATKSGKVKDIVYLEQALDDEVEKVEMLHDYTRFLCKLGYTDSDVWEKEPIAVDRYLEHIKKP